MTIRALPLAAVTLFLSAFSTIAHAEWIKSDQSLGWITDDGETIWQFSFDPTAGKPFYHPLRVPHGPPLTMLNPADHPWHYGLWFSWKYINQANYWEQNAETGRAEGATTWTPPHVHTLPDGRANITLHLNYVHPSGRIDLTESRLILISRVKTDGSYTIDWSSEFTAGPAGALLDRTPLPHELRLNSGERAKVTHDGERTVLLTVTWVLSPQHKATQSSYSQYLEVTLETARIRISFSQYHKSHSWTVDA